MRKPAGQESVGCCNAPPDMYWHTYTKLLCPTEHAGMLCSAWAASSACFVPCMPNGFYSNMIFSRYEAAGEAWAEEQCCARILVHAMAFRDDGHALYFRCALGCNLGEHPDFMMCDGLSVLVGLAAAVDPTTYGTVPDGKGNVDHLLLF
jgi:hypothetical protein